MISDWAVVFAEYVGENSFAGRHYDNDKKVLTFFDTVEDATKVFVEAYRKAKGTTSETGLVSSFFANPFGPYQRQEQTMEILDRVFKQLFDNNTQVGTIFTKLAVEGYEQKGPKEAATELFKLLIKK